MTIPSGLSETESRRFLRRQIYTGRYMILGTALITVLNILFLLWNVDFYITYSLALSYYAVWLGKGADNHFSYVWTENGTYTMTGLLIAAVFLLGLLALWHLAKQKALWMKVAVGLLAADLGVLLVLAVLLKWDLMNVLWELVIHGAVIWEMVKALQASRQLKQMLSEKEQG